MEPPKNQAQFTGQTRFDNSQLCLLEGEGVFACHAMTIRTVPKGLRGVNAGRGGCTHGEIRQKGLSCPGNRLRA
jgi:hypothetical protein